MRPSNTGKTYDAGGRCPETATLNLLADKYQYATSVSSENAYCTIAYDRFVKPGKACQLFRSGESSGARQYNPQSDVLPIAPIARSNGSPGCWWGRVAAGPFR